MAKPMKAKLKKYFEKMPPIITCAAALNPCFNVHGVELLIEDISFDVLGFWKSKESMFHVLSRMVMDVLSVQATSDHLDAQKCKQHISSLEGALDFKEEILTIEVQDNEATPLSDEEITLDAAPWHPVREEKSPNLITI
ncbi:zinc finger BED domain-containing protein RICESLEEPER 2-like protein [Tanacetum coccineum]